jgi:cytochrome c2
MGTDGLIADHFDVAAVSAPVILETKDPVLPASRLEDAARGEGVFHCVILCQRCHLRIEMNESGVGNKEEAWLFLFARK